MAKGYKKYLDRPPSILRGCGYTGYAVWMYVNIVNMQYDDEDKGAGRQCIDSS